MITDSFNGLSKNVKGILFTFVSSALFVAVGAMVRTLSERIDVFQILLFRQIVFLLILLPAIKANFQSVLKPRLVKFHAIRITGAFFALVLGFIAVSNLPFAEAAAIGFTQIFFVAMMSYLVLAEVVGIERIFTIVFGFIGILAVVQPEFKSASILYILVGFGAAFSAAITVLAVRKIAKQDTRLNLLAYQAFFVGVLAVIPSTFNWIKPTAFELFLLVFVGIISSIAQWFGVTAYKYGEANIIVNAGYIKIIYSLALGYWLFAETPNTTAIIGALIILFSPIVYPLLKQRRINAKAP